MVQRPTAPGTYAIFHTTMGDFVAVLYADKAPKTVANFVGLANGSREWTDPKTRQKVTGKPLYEGVPFHRVAAKYRAPRRSSPRTVDAETVRASKLQPLARAKYNSIGELTP